MTNTRRAHALLVSADSDVQTLIVNNKELDMALGILGALVGGVMFHLIGQTGVTGWNLWSVFVSVIGAALVLAAYHTISSGRRSAA